MLIRTSNCAGRHRPDVGARTARNRTSEIRHIHFKFRPVVVNQRLSRRPSFMSNKVDFQVKGLRGVIPFVHRDVTVFEGHQNSY
jgi:hypothetical protein